MCLASNIARRAGSASYYARLGIPKELQAHYPRTPSGDLKRELWQSLRTKDAREAATDRIGEGTAAASSAILDRLRQNVAAGNLGQVDLARHTNADSQEARIRVILDLIDQLRAKGAQLAGLDLAGRMFGTEFETRLRTGTDMVGAMRRALDGLTVGAEGRIVSPEEIARAEAMKRQLDEIGNKLANAIRPIQEDIAKWEQQQLQAWIDIKSQLADVVVLAGQVYKAFKSVGDYVSSLGNAKVFDNLNKWLDSYGLIDHSVLKPIDRTPAPGAPKDADAGGPLRIAVKPRADTSRSLPSLTPKAASAGTDLDEVQRFIDGLNKSAAALKAEADAFHASNAEKATAINLAKAHEVATAAGKTVTDAQAAAIRSASTATANYRDRLADLEQAQRQAADAARAFGSIASDALGDAILEGRDFNSILQDVSKTFARMALQSVFTGQGPLAGLFGTAPAASAGPNAVGGIAGMLPKLLGFAEGGHVRGPGTGTSDSILARLSDGEFVVRAEATRKHRALLEQINSGAVKAPGYAAGGFVGAPAPGASTGSAAPASVVSIAPSIYLTAAGGNPEQNADLAARVGEQLEGSMRALVTSELRKQMRPFGMLNR